jgi:NADH-quinone oxidoreductase subunit N
MIAGYLTTTASAAIESIGGPQIDYAKITPILLVLGAAMVSVVLEALLPRESRRNAQLVLVVAVLLGALISVFLLAGTNTLTANGALAIDAPGLFMQGSVLLLALLSALVMAERRVDPAGDAFTARASALPGSEDEQVFTRQGWLQTEIWPLFLFCVGGMLVFVVANDLLTMFVALEVMSLPLYLLVAMSRRRRLLSQEASLKYFLLGAFGSAFFLYGAALTYGFAGTLNFGEISDKLSSVAGPNGLLIAGIGLIAVGLLFKLGAVPFHQWVPDVYQGAPTPLTGFMAAAVKFSAFGALLRIMYVAFGGARWDWRPAFWVIAVLTMLIGVILALTQNDVKRMLAYSSIAHAGFLLIGVLATNNTGLGGTIFYLLAYGVSTIGAFALVSLVRDPAGEATSLSSWVGLGKRSPLVAGAFALFLLAFAGIPLTSGFVAKFYVFTAGVAGGATPVVIIAVVASAIAAFFYGRVIVLMFFTAPKADGPSVVIPSTLTAVSIGFCVALTVLLGVVPQAVLDVAEKASTFVR